MYVRSVADLCEEYIGPSAGAFSSFLDQCANLQGVHVVRTSLDLTDKQHVVPVP